MCKNTKVSVCQALLQHPTHGCCAVCRFKELGKAERLFWTCVPCPAKGHRGTCIDPLVAVNGCTKKRPPSNLELYNLNTEPHTHHRSRQVILIVLAPSQIQKKRWISCSPKTYQSPEVCPSALLSLLLTFILVVFGGELPPRHPKTLLLASQQCSPQG